MSQQTSATTCKAHDFYYSIKIRQMPGISVDIKGISTKFLVFVHFTGWRKSQLNETGNPLVDVYLSDVTLKGVCFHCAKGVHFS